ncbi:hypothetical protein GCM10009616_11980 [Microlunatus lacustris]
MGLEGSCTSSRHFPAHLAISEKTVKVHLTRIFAALDVYDRTSAALGTQRHGILDDTP